MGAGYDLYAAYDTEVPAHGKAMVKTDIAVKLPRCTYGRVAPRSGLAWKKDVDVGAGVIDRDYRGNVAVVLFNYATTPLQVENGDRVAKLILELYLEECRIGEVDFLDVTERGAGGFGATGVVAK